MGGYTFEIVFFPYTLSNNNVIIITAGKANSLHFVSGKP